MSKSNEIKAALKWMKKSDEIKSILQGLALKNRPDEIKAVFQWLEEPKKSDKIKAVLHQRDGQWTTTYLLDLRFSHWLLTVKNADEGNVPLLAELLLTEEEPTTDEAKALLTDFVGRYQIDTAQFDGAWSMEDRGRLALMLVRGGFKLKKKRGRQSTPIYARSDLDARIDCAIAEVHARRRHLPGNRNIVRMVAELHKIEETTLENALNGKRGSARRKKRRSNITGPLI
jgi:hypothetical protein